MTISLRWRLLLVTTSIAGAAMVGIGLFSSRITLTEIERSSGSASGATLDPETCRGPLQRYWADHHSWTAADGVLERLSGSKAQLLIASAEGAVVAAWPRDLAGARLIAGPKQVRLEFERRAPDGSVENQVMALRGAPHITLTEGGNALGELYVLPPRGDGIHRDIRAEVNRSIAKAVAVAFAIALLAAILLARYILKPVRALTAAAGRIAEGDFAQRVPAASSDEIGSLARSFNSMADRLADAEQLRRDMVNDVSHELRTPLTSIRCQVESIQDGLAPLTAETVGGLHEQLLVLERLVDDLRDLALSDAGQLKVTLAPVRLDEVIHGAIASANLLGARKGLSIEAALPAVIPPVIADEGRLRQVLDNLTSNAIRYAPDHGRIVISARDAGDRVEVSVRDNGPGIPADQVAKVFERFHRVDDSRARSTGGSGLGLAIVKELVEAQGGTVRVESRNGGGSTFLFTLLTAPS